MKVEFLKAFEKDIEEIQHNSTRKALLKIIEIVDKADNIYSLPNLKKLKGHKSAFRVRIGDYRLGLFCEKDKVIFARIVHRKDIYRLFP